MTMIEMMQDRHGCPVVVNWEAVCYAKPLDLHEKTVLLQFESASLEVQTTIDWCFEQMGTACGYTQERNR